MTNDVKRIAQAIKSRDEAEMLLRRIGDSMVKLVQIFEQETKLIEGGQIASAAQLTTQKTDLAATYLREIELLKSNSGFIGQTVPVLVDELRRAHQTFREILNHNLRVVATAQSVAEGIMRGASEEAARKSTPQGYGANGKTATPVNGGRPVMVSRAS
jgi:flagellar biosynthesis/type III secretory pathway chaperone